MNIDLARGIKATPVANDSTLRHDWTAAEAASFFTMPFADLIFRAQTVHRAHFDANEVQMSTLLSIKTGGCPEDCGYCSQSSHFDTGLKATKLMDVEAVTKAAAAGEGRRRLALLHGRGLARAEGPRHRRASATWSAK